MLKFKAKKTQHFPITAIIIWLLSLMAIIGSTNYADKLNLVKLLAINPATFLSASEQSWWHGLRLISALFVHGSWQHWAGNMILFLIIALPLERRTGAFWFIVMYFSAGVAGNIASIYQLNHSSNYLLGASGALSGLLGVWIFLYPRQNISLIIPIGLYLQKAKMPIFWLAFIWLGLQIVLQLLSHNDFPIVWLSHIVGFIVGFLVAWLYRIKT